MADCKCCDPLHSTRARDAGWCDSVLATTTKAPVQMLCSACAAAQALLPPTKDPLQTKIDDLEARLAAAESKLATISTTVPK